MKITYQNQELKLRCRMREFMVFEKLNNGTPFEGDDSEDYVKLFFSSIICALGYQPPLDDFLEFLKHNEDALVEFVKENFKID